MIHTWRRDIQPIRPPKFPEVFSEAIFDPGNCSRGNEPPRELAAFSAREPTTTEISHREPATTGINGIFFVTTDHGNTGQHGNFLSGSRSEREISCGSQSPREVTGFALFFHLARSNYFLFLPVLYRLLPTESKSTSHNPSTNRSARKLLHWRRPWPLLCIVRVFAKKKSD